MRSRRRQVENGVDLVLTVVWIVALLIVVLSAPVSSHMTPDQIYSVERRF